MGVVVEGKEAIDLIPVDVTPELRDMVARHPLPKGVPDADMNQADMAAALQVTVNTLGKWVDDDTFPVAQRGGMGKPYILRLSHCWAWKQERDAQEAVRRAHNQNAIDKLNAHFLGLDLEDDGATLSAKDRRALADADFAHSRAAHMRRQLVRLDEVVELMEAVFSIVRNGIEGMPDRLERELGLKPEQVDLVDRVGSDILNSVVQKIEDAELEERNIADVQPSNQLLI